MGAKDGAGAATFGQAAPHRPVFAVDVLRDQSLCDQSAAPINTPAARPLVTSHTTNDVDEQAALLHGWNQTYNQLSSGSFSGYLVDAHLADFHLFREVTSNSLHQTGEPGNGHIAVGVPLSLKGAATFCGRPCDGSQLHVFSGRDGFEFHSPSGLDIAGFVVSRDSVLARCSPRERDFLEQTLYDPHLRPAAAAALDRLRALFAGAVEAMDTTPALATSSGLASVLANDVLAALTDALMADLPCDAVFTSTEKRWQIVRSAREIASSRMDAALSVEDLCAALGVSRRTLQYCFQEALSIAPAQYLRAVRLNGARRTLKAGGTVTDAATTWGFWHFGRFAQDYKALFGELPSSTARRIQAAAPERPS